MWLSGFPIKRQRRRSQWLALKATFALLFSLSLPGNSFALAAVHSPIKVSANHRYLVDQNQQPFLIIGDAPHTLLVNLNASDAWVYLVNRGSNGFNSLWVECLAGSYVGGRTDGSNLAGDTPFTGTLPGGKADFTTPREAYWTHVDTILRMAATNGLMVFLDPLETGDWTDDALANGSARCRAYGQFLGDRYQNFSNLVWLTGNDFQTWQVPTNDAVVTAIALGIQDRDTNHLQTVQLNYNVSESLDDPNWWPIISLNSVYTYYPTYAETLNAYNHTNFVPVYLLEAHYEYENVAGEMGTPNVLRRQEYWSMLSGAIAGHMYGNHYTWTFDNGWKNFLDSPGKTQLMLFRDFFTARPWYALVPDQEHSVVTAGFGSYSDSGLVSGNDYATAARTGDGNLIVVYLPTRRTITVDMSKLSGPATAQWFDPSSGTYFNESGSPFTNSGTRSFTPAGNNRDGEGDWVLVLSTPVPSPNLMIVNLGNGSFRIQFEGVPGTTYRIEYKEKLTDPDWLPLGLSAAGESGVVEFIDTPPPVSTTRVYRSRYP